MRRVFSFHVGGERGSGRHPGLDVECFMMRCPAERRSALGRAEG